MIKLRNGTLPIYYEKGKTDLVLFCVHGAGLSAHSFAILKDHLETICGIVSYDI